MKSERWKRIQELFDEALEQDADARRDWLRSRCGDDAALFEEVVSLLDADERPGDAVSEAVAGSVETGDPRLGQRLGPYRIERALGHGGMGTVYLAVRDDAEYEHRVAIKLVRGGVLDPDLLQRFRAERQILARLEHPNIARLVDGGTTPDGVPYVVMEYVDGVPIHTYAQQQKLSVRERLDLFRLVCGAVAYAHTNLVVHRDIKPHNVLVTSDGQPKLLDFGIAKLLDRDDPTAPATRTGMRMLTPEYASPEQLRGHAVTTASDVYSLGVLLYELLTGRRPFALTDDRPDTFERRVIETEPLRPSDTDGIEHRRDLCGDLDNIALMALRKEPERRYASVEKFSEDVRCYLAGLPVSARPNTLRYRTVKFAGRHKWSVTAAALGLATLVLFAVAMAVQAGRIARERDLVAIERLKAEQVSSFLLELFRVADPEETSGETVTARQLLDEGAERLRGELADQPVVRANMLQVIGNAYGNLGLYARAAEVQRERLADFRSRTGDDVTAELSAALTDLANSLLELGELEEAESYAREAVQTSERLNGPDSEQAAFDLHHLGRILQLRGETDEAVPLFRRALAILATVPEPDVRLEIAATQHLSQVIQDEGRFDEAVEMLRRVVAISESAFGSAAADTIESHHNLAVSLHQAGRLEEAEHEYRYALREDQRIFGPDHPKIGVDLTNLARLLQERGDLDEAEPLSRRALAITRAGHGDDHPYTGYDAVNLARILRDRGDLSEALALVDEALAIYTAELDADHPWTASTLIERGRLLTVLGRPAEALEPLARALTICRSVLGEDHWLTALCRGVSGYALGELGRVEEARALLGPARDRLAETRGQSDPRTRDVDRWLRELAGSR